MPDSINKLASKFSKLPGVGSKSALRYAYAVLDMSEDEVDAFCEALKEVKEKVKFCIQCGDYSETDICPICASRTKKTICVVAQPRDIAAMEKAKIYKGVYHVLRGTISPLDGRGPNEIRIKELLGRLDGVEEVIVATNPDVEGEATAMYIARLIRPLGIKVTRLAQGISMGSDIEYADEVTLSKAIEARTEI